MLSYETIKTIVLDAVNEMLRKGESAEMLARWISERIHAAGADRAEQADDHAGSMEKLAEILKAELEQARKDLAKSQGVVSEHERTLGEYITRSATRIAAAEEQVEAYRVSSRQWGKELLDRRDEERWWRISAEERAARYDREREEEHDRFLAMETKQIKTEVDLTAALKREKDLKEKVDFAVAYYQKVNNCTLTPWDEAATDGERADFRAVLAATPTDTKGVNGDGRRLVVVHSRTAMADTTAPDTGSDSNSGVDSPSALTTLAERELIEAATALTEPTFIDHWGRPTCVYCGQIIQIHVEPHTGHHGECPWLLFRATRDAMPAQRAGDDTHKPAGS